MTQRVVRRMMIGVLAVFAAPVFGATALYTVALDGPSESPPNASPGTGSGVVAYDDVAHTLHIQLTFSDLIGTTTAAHIHSPTAVPGTGTVGVATQVPSFAGFPLGVTSGVFDQTYDLTQASSWNPSFINANGGTPASAELALATSMAEGRAYFNIHTSEYTGGEIRGFLQLIPEPATIGLLAVGALAFGTRRKRA